MEILQIYQWVQNNWVDIVQLYGAIVAVASIIVKLTPTLKDDTWLLNVVKFLGRYIALNRTVNDNDVRAHDPELKPDDVN